MTTWQQTMIVARWEFQRFVKWRQQFIGVAVSLAVGAALGVFGMLSARAKPSRSPSQSSTPPR